MNPEIKAQWVAALRSGEYRQGRGALNANEEYCCLGVLCDLAYKAGIAERRGADGYTRYDESSTLLPMSVMEWSGVENKFGSWGPNQQDSLTHQNDMLHKDFREIADLIEEHF